MFDYETLKLLWWALIGILLIGFVVTDGFDMGVGALLLFVGKTDDERRVMLNTVGPHWEGNQVWLVTAIGALFAAWPLVYAMAFSGFYLLMMITLFALFLRPIGFDYRSKIQVGVWCSSWDRGLFIGSTIPPLMFGLIFGNLLQGIPFYFDDTMRGHYAGSFIDLLNPFALLTAVISLTMVVMHGAAWLQMRTLDSIESRSRSVAKLSSLSLFVLFSLAGIWLYTAIDGFVITQMPDPNSSFMPQAKHVIQQQGAWLLNYQHQPWLLLAPLSVFIGSLLVYVSAHYDRARQAFVISALTLAGVILTAGISMFPFVMPSSIIARHSLTLWDASSSQLTLQIMFWVAALIVPIILGYTIWTYSKMWRRINTQFIIDNQHSTY